MQLVKTAKELSPDVVFIDIGMPVIDGLTAAKEISEQNKDAFIVFATAHDNYTHEALQVRAFDYLLKPFSLERIQQVLQRIKTVKSAKAEDFAQSATSNAASQAQMCPATITEK
jgi:two-component system LytT family response regulator